MKYDTCSCTIQVKPVKCQLKPSLPAKTVGPARYATLPFIEIGCIEKVLKNIILGIELLEIAIEQCACICERAASLMCYTAYHLVELLSFLIQLELAVFIETGNGGEDDACTGIAPD